MKRWSTHSLSSRTDSLIHLLNWRLFLSLPGVVDGRLLQGQARAGVQNHGGLHKGPKLCAAPVTSPLGRNWPRGLQRFTLLQQTSEQHSGRRLECVAVSQFRGCVFPRMCPPSAKGRVLRRTNTSPPSQEPNRAFSVFPGCIIAVLRTSLHCCSPN